MPLAARLSALFAVMALTATTAACSGADSSDAAETDESSAALSSCTDYGYVTPNTHSTDGHAICLHQRSNGRFDVKCMDGRRTTTWDYGVALRFCNVAKPLPPPPPTTTATVSTPPPAACTLFRTMECFYDKTDGVCFYDCGGVRSSAFAPCDAPGRAPHCPAQP